LPRLPLTSAQRDGVAVALEKLDIANLEQSFALARAEETGRA